MTDKKEALTALAQALLEKEVLFQNDLESLVGPRPFEQLTTYQEFIKGETEKKRKDAKEEREQAENEKIAEQKPKTARKPKAKKEESPENKDLETPQEG